MKQDAEVLLMLRERAKGRTQEQAAARAGMSVRTARAYERRARLPSQLKQPRTYRSRPNPFADDWPWIAQLLKDDKTRLAPPCKCMCSATMKNAGACRLDLPPEARG